MGRFSASLYAKKKKKKKNYLSTTCGCKQKLNKRDGKRKKEGRILYKQLLFLIAEMVGCEFVADE